MFLKLEEKSKKSLFSTFRAFEVAVVNWQPSRTLMKGHFVSTVAEIGILDEQKSPCGRVEI